MQEVALLGLEASTPTTPIEKKPTLRKWYDANKGSPRSENSSYLDKVKTSPASKEERKPRLSEPSKPTYVRRTTRAMAKRSTLS